MRNTAPVAAIAALIVSPAVAQELQIDPPDRDIQYSPYLQEDFPNQVFFGDTHLHTAFSADAGLAFATTTPDDAYRFAKGEEVISSQELPARLKRPLDFLVVADHAEKLDIALALQEENPILDYNEWSRTLAETYAPRTIEAVSETYVQWFGAVNTPGGGEIPDDKRAFQQERAYTSPIWYTPS